MWQSVGHKLCLVCDSTGALLEAFKMCSCWALQEAFKAHLQSSAKGGWQPLLLSLYDHHSDLPGSLHQLQCMAQNKALLRMPSRPIAWQLKTSIFVQDQLEDDDAVDTLGAAAASMSRWHAVLSRRLLCASAKPPGSCKCWALLQPVRKRHGASRPEDGPGQMPPPERMTAGLVIHKMRSSCMQTRLNFMAGTESFPDMVVSQRWSSA